MATAVDVSGAAPVPLEADVTHVEAVVLSSAAVDTSAPVNVDSSNSAIEVVANSEGEVCGTSSVSPHNAPTL